MVDGPLHDMWRKVGLRWTVWPSRWLFSRRPGQAQTPVITSIEQVPDEADTVGAASRMQSETTRQQQRQHLHVLLGKQMMCSCSS